MARMIFIFFFSVLLAFAYNQFLLPHQILSGGISGIAMIIGLLTPMNTGIANLILNIPIFMVGYIKLGKKFILSSIFSVVVASIALVYIPVAAFSQDPVLSSIFGGVLAGVAVGFIFRSSASTGGFDIIGLLLTNRKEIQLGNLIFLMNAVVIFISGFLFNWDVALYTMLSIFATGKVIDTIYTNHVKLTLMIITGKGEEVRSRLLAKLGRGITILDGEGAYTKEKRKILFMVISRYELADVKKIVKEADTHAFINVTKTVEVIGFFRRN
jgi:uncharacterized membrane-anchored protein YitT (DUF2179 family)